MKMKKFTVLYQWPKLYRKSYNIRTFKRLLKSYLINLQNTQ